MVGDNRGRWYYGENVPLSGEGCRQAIRDRGLGVGETRTETAPESPEIDAEAETANGDVPLGSY